MLASLIIVFREVLEAALVISIVFAATRGLDRRTLWVNYGIAAGIAGAGVVALFARAIASAASGMGQELFNAGVLFLAVGVLGWTVVWMRRHGRELARHANQVGKDVAAGSLPLYALAVIVSLAVLREGSETVLFLYGVAAGGSQAAPVLAGGVLGLLAGTAVGAAMYIGLLRISSRHLFTVTSWLLAVLAAGMASQGAGFLVQADLLPPLVQPLWDTSGLLSEGSLAGQFLHALMGYSARPAGVQVLFYASTFGLIGVLMHLWGKSPSPEASPSKAAACAAACVIGAGLALAPAPAVAGPPFHIESPIVEKGEVEVENKFSFTVDSDKNKDNELKNAHEIELGVTDRWSTSLEGEWEREPGGSHVFEATEWENVIQLFEQGERWLDAGLFAGYEIPRESGKADEIKLGILLQKATGRLLHTANLFLEKQIGAHAEEDAELQYGWQTKLRLHPALEVGFEAFGEFGALKENAGSVFRDHEHKLGPVAFGKVRLGKPPLFLKYEAGYLFGLTGVTPNGTVKGIVEVEFRW